MTVAFFPRLWLDSTLPNSPEIRKTRPRRHEASQKCGDSVKLKADVAVRANMCFVLICGIGPSWHVGLRSWLGTSTHVARNFDYHLHVQSIKAGHA